MELINEDDKWKSEIINGNCSIIFDDKWKSEASTKK